MILTLTCDQSSRLVSDSQERELELHERVALRLHMASCKGCRRMRVQFKQLHKIALRFRKGKTPQLAGLSKGSRERIQKKIEKK